MSATDTVVIGAGHAGLAVSHLLTRAGRDHVVLDRGRIAESWRTARWDSLQLLTPRWMTRLPGRQYTGPDQEGFMGAAELVGYLEEYADASASPVETGQQVLDVSSAADGYRVVTTDRTWQARQVVVATGSAGRPHLPATSERLHPDVALLPASDYRNPEQLAPGGVLVVGASASGTQIADELARSGRRVLLSVGRHSRLPRRYRGMDIFWWLERTGRLARHIDDIPDGDGARGEPSLQLAGRDADDPRGTEVDLSALQAAGVELTGRLDRFDRHHVDFRADLADTTADADAQMRRFLDTVDAHIAATGLSREVERRLARPEPPSVDGAPRRLDLRAEGISTVLLATGYRPDHPWLRVPVIGKGGVITQQRGVTPAPGLYVVGQRFQHRRDATFIDGARFGARDVVSHICGGDVTAPLAWEEAQ